MDESIDIVPPDDGENGMSGAGRQVFSVLFFSLFATITGVGIVVPLLPVYARDLGASGLYIGLIFGSFSFSRTLFLPYFGRLSDRKGRKPFIVAGLFTYALISAAFILSQSVETLIAIRTVQGVASAMIMPVIQAYVGDVTLKGKEGFTMGIFNMSVFFGLSIGPLAGGVINEHFSLNAAFGCMGIMAFVGFLLSMVFLPPTHSERARHPAGRQIAWRRLVLDRDVAALFVFRFCYTACIGIVWGFLPVLADAEFDVSSSAIGVLVMLAVFVSGLIQTPMGFLADRLNRQAMVAVGGCVVSYAIYSYESASGFGDLVAASVIFGLGGGIAMPAVMAIAVRIGARNTAMGSIMGILTMAHSLGMMSGAFLAGIMMDLFQLRQAFYLGMILMSAGTVLFLLLKPRSAPDGQGH